MRVQGSGRVRARIVVDRHTCEVTRQTPGVPIEEWEAEVMGELDQYLQRRERRRNSPLDMSRWELGAVIPGIPKNSDKRDQGPA